MKGCSAERDRFENFARPFYLKPMPEAIPGGSR